MNKYFVMKNLNTMDTITYTFYPEVIEKNHNNIIEMISKISNDNQMAMDIINGLVAQGYIIAEFNLL